MGEWLHTQRRQKTAGILSSFRIEKMNQLVAQGKFSWNLHFCTKNLLRKEKQKENEKHSNGQDKEKENNDDMDDINQDMTEEEEVQAIKRTPKG